MTFCVSGDRKTNFDVKFTFNCFYLSFYFQVVRPSVAVTCLRHYADLPQLTFDQIEARTLNLLKLFDKVDPDKVRHCC